MAIVKILRSTTASATPSLVSGQIAINEADDKLFWRHSDGTIKSMKIDQSSVVITGGSITGMPSPTNASDVATKSYVDSVASGLSIRNSVRVASTANLTATYANGTAGVGATLTNSGAQAAIAIDGVTLAANDRVLVKNQSTSYQNGIYKVTTLGSGSTNWVLTRATDADEAAEIFEGIFTHAEEGTSWGGTGWVLTTNGAVTVGTTGLTFTQFNAVPEGAVLTTNNLSDLGSASTARTNLGLGTAATQNTGTSGGTIPLLNAANTFSAKQIFTAAMKLQEILELVTVSATAATGTINYDVLTQAVMYYTSNASANWTLNVRGNAGTTLDATMATGESLTLAFLVTQGSTAYYQSAFTIDGNSITPKWLGGSAPAAGNASGIDIYTITIIKTGSATFTAIASQTQAK